MPTPPNIIPVVVAASLAASAGSTPLDPVMRTYFEARWRACITELRMIAPLLGWQDRIPGKNGGN